MGQRIVKIVKPHKKVGSVAVLAPQSEWEYTFYQLDAMGNVLATYHREYELVSGSTYKSKYGLEEQYIYGSSRLGSIEQNQPDFESTFTATITTTGTDDDDEYFVLTSGFSSNAYAVNPGTSGVYEEYDHKTGWRHYEQTNHLGNVMSTISDRKVPVDRYNFINTGGSYTHGLSSVMGTYVTGATTLTHKIGTGTDGTADGWMAEVQSYGDYYAFGALMPGRNGNAGSYNYGYQGQEQDNEIKGDANSIDFGARFYDPRLGRFLSIDPLAAEYSFMSPYCYAANNPIAFIDENGEGPKLPPLWVQNYIKTKFSKWAWEALYYSNNTSNSDLYDWATGVKRDKFTYRKLKGAMGEAILYQLLEEGSEFDYDPDLGMRLPSVSAVGIPFISNGNIYQVDVTQFVGIGRKNINSTFIKAIDFKWKFYASDASGANELISVSSSDGSFKVIRANYEVKAFSAQNDVKTLYLGLTKGISQTISRGVGDTNAGVLVTDYDAWMKVINDPFYGPMLRAKYNEMTANNGKETAGNYLILLHNFSSAAENALKIFKENVKK